MADALRRQLLDSGRGRIVSLLQRGGLTAHDIAARLGLTRSAIRIHIKAMERDGVVLRESSGREIYVVIRPRKPPVRGS